MDAIIILFAFSACCLVIAIWTWRMPEKRWLNRLETHNRLGLDISKYNPKKIKSITMALFLFEAACLFLIGLTGLIGLNSEEHPVLFLILAGGLLAGVIVYYILLYVYCKKSKNKKRQEKYER